MSEKPETKVEKYYVCSESELAVALHAAHYCGYQHALYSVTDEGEKELVEAEAACRAREVTLYERCHDDNEKPVGNIWLEEIKR